MSSPTADRRPTSLIWETLRFNVRYAARRLARAPAFTATVLLTIAVSIGANSTVFSAIDAVLLRPLPYPDADRLMHVMQARDERTETNIAPVRLEDWNRLSATFAAITGYSANDVSDTTGEAPEPVRLAGVAPRFLEVWGVAPAIGRGFRPEEHRLGAPQAVVISDRYWRRRLNADPQVLERTLRVEEQSYSIIGVLPESFLFPDRQVDLWSALPFSPAQPRGDAWYIGVGRLKPGVTLEQARADLAWVQTQLGAQYPEPDAKIGVRVAPLKDTIVGDIRESLWLVFAAVCVLLLIACTNIASLLLARAAQREQEVVVRYSLGASRAAVAIQMLTEAALLAFVGAAIGLLAAAAAPAVFQALAPDLPRLDEIAIDGRIALYTVGTTVVVALLCGVFPAIRSTRGSDRLTWSSRTQLSTRSTLQWVLVGLQVALSVTLLTGAGLLLRSFDALSRVDPGFEASRVLTFRVSANWGEMQDYGHVLQRVNGTLDALRGLPGVQAAATTIIPPGVPAQFQTEFGLAEGRADGESAMTAEGRMVSPSYFETLAIPLVAGELCRQPAPGRMNSELMVNRSFVDRYLAGRSAVGLTLSGQVGGRIVGVVGDARELGTNREPAPTVYGCASAPHPFPWFVVRTSGEPLVVAASVRARLRELEPLRSVYDVAPLEERIGDAYAQNKLRTALLVFFSVTALGLACLGVYGTLSYVASLSRREVGLRVAFGAVSSNIVSQFLSKVLRVTGLACAAGVILSLVFARVLSGMLYGVAPWDPATLAGVVAVVTIVALLAALLPVLRAAQIEPMQVLRDQ